MSVVAWMAKLIVASAGSKGAMVVFNSVVAFKSSDKRHQKIFYKNNVLENEYFNC